jgi:hypothetical protein
VAMRCDDRIYGSLFNYIDFCIDLEKRVLVDHPLRVIRQIANAALKCPRHLNRAGGWSPQLPRPKWLPRKHTSRRLISHFSVTC